MIVLSAGMQKSGSAYLYNILNDLLVAAGKADARLIKSRYGLDGIMRWHNNNIDSTTFAVLFRLWRISLQEKSFVVKTHAPPGPSLRILNMLGMVRVIYGFRDPRDVMLSAADHGKKILAEGAQHTFAGMVEFDDALRIIKSWLEIWRCYNTMGNVLMVPYEKLVENPEAVLRSCERFLRISITDTKRREIVWRYDRNNPAGERSGMHFNRALAYRYRQEMPEALRNRCRDELGSYLRAMGYSLE